MKKLLIWMIAMLMVFSCAHAEMDDPEGTTCLSLDEKLEIDLDGDNETEIVQLRMEGVEDEDCLRIIIEGTDGAMNIYDTLIMRPYSCFAIDMNGDGLQEIILSGDLYSDDYVTWCLNYDLETGIQDILFADAHRGMNTGEYTVEGYGRVIALDGNSVTLRGSQDVLGTWMADRTFTLKDGRFELEDGGMWLMEDITGDESIWDYACLNPVKEVPVTFEDGSEGSLAVGEKFVITSTDKLKVAGFITQGGKKGNIAIEKNMEDGWGYKIAGVADYEYFEYVPYAD